MNTRMDSEGNAMEREDLFTPLSPKVVVKTGHVCQTFKAQAPRSSPQKLS